MTFVAHFHGNRDKCLSSCGTLSANVLWALLPPPLLVGKGNGGGGYCLIASSVEIRCFFLVDLLEIISCLVDDRIFI